MNEYRVYLMLGNIRRVAYGESKGYVVAKSPKDGLKKLLKCKASEIKKIDSKSTTKYRGKSECIFQVENPNGIVSYYAYIGEE